MDALASLAFGIIVVNVIKSLGVTEPGAVASNTVKSGIFSCLFMAGIYVAVAVVGTQSRGAFATSENGGIALAQIAEHYLGFAGLIVLAATVTLACLKTAVGLITSCAETFTALFRKGPNYRTWAIIFSALSFIFSNFGLSNIITYSVPVLMFLYPLAIVLILLALFGKFFGHDKKVYAFTIGFTLLPSLYDGFMSLNKSVTIIDSAAIEAITSKYLPFSALGLGWICPAALGLIIGLIVHFASKSKQKPSLG